mmetsp:Transcript_17791/g.41047  ORF Transcript_17791/g.41047 Transcript_17791/m.41047 type:complete len:227 (-) Transcript_17791:621-1301(-)
MRTDATSDQSIVETVASSKIDLLRVRVVNGDTGISKDLLVEVRNDDGGGDGGGDESSASSLFEAIYDHASVKRAGVRKWSPDAARKVKSGTHEIVCSVWATRNNNDDDDHRADEAVPLRVYSVRDLKRTSPRELLDLCGTDRNEDPGIAGTQLRLELSLRVAQQQQQTQQTNHQLAVPPGHPGIPMHHPAIGGDGGGDGKPILRCPFSGIAFDESVLEQFFDRKHG